MENRVFSKDGSNLLSDKFIAVKLLGGQDKTPSDTAIMKRYNIGGYPTLLGLSADGAVLQKNFKRNSTATLVEGMEEAAKNEKEFVAKLAAFEAKKDDPAMQRELSELYMGRMQFDKARPIVEKLAESGEVKDLQALLSLQESLDDKDAGKKTLATLAEKFPDHEDYADWRIQLATADLPSPRSAKSREEFTEISKKHLEATEKLLEELKPAHHAGVRETLMNMSARTGDFDKIATHANWILENAPKHKAAPPAMLTLASLSMRKAQMNKDLASAEKAKELILKLHADYPDSNETAKTKSGAISQIDGVINALKEAAEKAKAAEEAEAENVEEKEEPAEAK